MHVRIEETVDRMQEVMQLAENQPMGFFILRCAGLRHSIQVHSDKWVAAYGELLRQRAHSLCRELTDKIRVRVCHCGHSQPISK